MGKNAPTASLLSQDPCSDIVSSGTYETFSINEAEVALLYPSWSSEWHDDRRLNLGTMIYILNCQRMWFGFQLDSLKNTFELLMSQLDSRAARMGPKMALICTHADYFGGDHANYRKWLFGSKMNLESSVDPASWKSKMRRLSPSDMWSHLTLYNLCWTESTQLRYMPECLCFIYKCCLDSFDYAYGNGCVETANQKGRGSYLDEVVSPLYKYLHCQVYEINTNIRLSKDHASTVGYDDVNQLFWYLDGIRRLTIRPDGKSILDYPENERYHVLKDVHWDLAFQKTYREARSWMHLLVNFGRIWICHTSMFWYFTVLNCPVLYTSHYDYRQNNQPPAHIKWSVFAAGGAIGPLINLVSTLWEVFFVPMSWPGSGAIWSRSVLLLSSLGATAGVPAYILTQYSHSKEEDGLHPVLTVIVVLSIVSTTVFSIMPLKSLSFNIPTGKSAETLCSTYFSASFPALSPLNRLISCALWACIFLCKMMESFFFLSVSLRVPVIAVLSSELNQCLDDSFLGGLICRQQTKVTLTAMLMLEFTLFYLDTYLWYICFSTLFSVVRMIYLGQALWTPLRSIYFQLPVAIYRGLVSHHSSKKEGKSSTIALIWNRIVAHLYWEHVLDEQDLKRWLLGESDDSCLDGFDPTKFSESTRSLLASQPEEIRRISFFAQSLCMNMPEPCSVAEMPRFTVMIPHYKEKILLTQKDILREEDDSAKISLLEYLRVLHKKEWKCCYERSTTRVGRDSGEVFMGARLHLGSPLSLSEPSPDIHIGIVRQYVGYVHCTSENLSRTKRWASRRAQTLYRTIAGFSNYSAAINLMYESETSDTGDDSDLTRKQASALQKCRTLVSIQRYHDMLDSELELINDLLSDYPNTQIAYIEREIVPTGETRYYSCLFDYWCPFMLNDDGTPSKRRLPKLRIRLAGNPLLGDGKSDNQNHALVFYRGEYIQLVDANQDNYLEECLKIRSVLAEFEQMDMASSGKTPYHSGWESRSPVAIVGAREYIFSENIGVLGDIAAGKEQTFGTLFARSLATVGGKLHYGHSDFLNGIFMATRGGVSKAQRGLHLNEDIYAGMNAMLRDGRIKHCDYFQCGKGRDIGFTMIANFINKIGAGMGEQFLSREYYYFGTQLACDRFLTFYYAHPGFHIHNLLITLSTKMFLLTALNVNALASGISVCSYNKDQPITDTRIPYGCLPLRPIFGWIQHRAISVLAVVFISFVPLFVQELSERGIIRSFVRLGKQFLSFSPLYEVFLSQLYANSLTNDMVLGGARYVPTGRGFATTRVPFRTLYSQFAPKSIYLGVEFLTHIVYITATKFFPVYVIWWLTAVAFCLCPFVYNPHQFSLVAFLLDYGDYLKWLFHHGPGDTWGDYFSRERAKLTGARLIGDEAGTSAAQLLGLQQPRRNTDRQVASRTQASASSDCSKPSLQNMFMKAAYALSNSPIAVMPYLYVCSHTLDKSDILRGVQRNTILRLGVIAGLPIAMDISILVVVGLFALNVGAVERIIGVLPHCGHARKKVMTPVIVGGLLRILSTLRLLLFFDACLVLHNYRVIPSFLGAISGYRVQSQFLEVIYLVLLRGGTTQPASWCWLAGTWSFHCTSVWSSLVTFLRETANKFGEAASFGSDFLIGHMLLFVLLLVSLIPRVDKWHSVMLFWWNPRELGQGESRITRRQTRSARRRSVLRAIRNGLFMAIVVSVCVCLALGVLFLPHHVQETIASLVDGLLPELIFR